MANPYQAPDSDSEPPPAVALPEWLATFEDPTVAALWVCVVCAGQVALGGFLYLTARFEDWSLVKVTQVLLLFSLPLLLLSLVRFGHLVTRNSVLFRPAKFSLVPFWAWSLVLPVVGVVLSYLALRSLAQANGAPITQRFALTWALSSVLLSLALPFLHPETAAGVLGTLFPIGQLCLGISVWALRSAQVRLARLASVAEVLLRAKRDA